MIKIRGLIFKMERKIFRIKLFKKKDLLEDFNGPDQHLV